ncbi:hypothetical protein HB904_09360 [Listeria booriae]|uniref:Uncharacterized protein n=1 Tax=Listeria booriae TaxID=1552123 RepID=A0A842ABI6_9LIST|nr:hypothetical protein [Listeria booriae]MBC1616396.1 hypothetical protein [Listeria booriae]
MIFKRHWLAKKPKDFFENFWPEAEGYPLAIDWAKAGSDLSSRATVVNHLPPSWLKLSEAERVFYRNAFNEELAIEVEGIRVQPESYTDQELQFYVDGKFVGTSKDLSFTKEETKLEKLEISEELHERITLGLTQVPNYDDSELVTLFNVISVISLEDLKKDGLGVQDVYDLAMGNYTVKPKFEVGKYYYSCRAIFKVIGLKDNGVAAMFLYGGKKYVREGIFQYESPRFMQARPAKKNEIKLFNRAEQFQKQARELNEFKFGDVVRRAQGEPFYFRETHEGEEPTLTLICTKEKRCDL